MRCSRFVLCRPSSRRFRLTSPSVTIRGSSLYYLIGRNWIIRTSSHFMVCVFPVLFLPKVPIIYGCTGIITVPHLHMVSARSSQLRERVADSSPSDHTMGGKREPARLRQEPPRGGQEQIGGLFIASCWESASLTCRGLVAWLRSWAMLPPFAGHCTRIW